MDNPPNVFCTDDNLISRSYEALRTSAGEELRRGLSKPVHRPDLLGRAIHGMIGGEGSVRTRQYLHRYITCSKEVIGNCAVRKPRPICCWTRNGLRFLSVMNVLWADVEHEKDR